VELLIGDGLVEEFGGRSAGPARTRKPKAAKTEPARSGGVRLVETAHRLPAVSSAADARG
jgi:hypothetical protein